MEVSVQSAGGWDSTPPDAAPGGGWDALDTVGGSAWENSVSPAARHQPSSWGGEPSSSNGSTKQHENSRANIKQPATDQPNPWESSQPPKGKNHDNPWESARPSAKTNGAGTWDSGESSAAPTSGWDSGEPSAAPTSGWDSGQPSSAPSSAWDSCEPTAASVDAWDSVNPSANTQRDDPWESVKSPSSRPAESSWDTGAPASKRPRISTDPQNQQRSQPPRSVPEKTVPRECRELEVPESAVGHIVGQSSRNVLAFQRVPGITRVSTYKMRAPGTDENDKKVIHKVKVEGSSMEAINSVIKQIQRIVIRSATNPPSSDVTVICFREKREGEEGLSMELTTAEVFQHYLPKQLKSFVVRFAPEEAQKKQYFCCSRRIASDQVPDNAKFTSRKKARSYAGDVPVHLSGSWASKFYITPISSCLHNFYHLSLQGGSRGGPPMMKVRIQLGKMLFFGTDLGAPDTWNMTLPDIETMTAEKTLKHCFSSYCHPETMDNARKLLEKSGYIQHGIESSQDAICAELVDMDSTAACKPTFNIRFLQKDEIVAKINKKSKRHAFLTFVDESSGHDFQLRIQSRMQEPALDQKILKSVYEAWTKRGDMEDPLTSPSGHHYFPVRILRKVYEYYRKDGTEVVLTQVSPISPPSTSGGEEAPDNSRRWKICFKQSFTPSTSENVDETVEHTVVRLAELVAEVKKFSERLTSVPNPSTLDGYPSVVLDLYSAICDVSYVCGHDLATSSYRFFTDSVFEQDNNTVEHRIHGNVV
ncbi:hypothetical protein R1sor_018986 [Riccia sorocarpa]|uniref:Uncharacterized protein n=1 Tax=Riccia sorocarpa TaxID=122646 RepID=A0ABD3IEK5_9MARC